MSESLDPLKYSPLSETDIIKYLDGKTKICKYNEIQGVSNIETLLSPYGNCIILLETEPDFGHWICLKKTNRPNIKFISFFDSYGDFPDKQKHYIDEDFLQSSGQKFNKICKLLYDASFNGWIIEFSHRRLQNLRNAKMATCGHWCSVFIKSGLTVDEFNKYIDSFGIKNKDDLIVMLYFNIIPKKEQNKPERKKIKF